MATTVTIVDPSSSTMVIETSEFIEVFIGSETTSVKIAGVDRPSVTTKPEELQVRTADPEDQTITVTEQPEDGPAKELPQEQPTQCAGPHRLRFFQEFDDVIQAKCMNDNQLITIVKDRYSDKELEQIKFDMIGYKAPEAPESAQEAPSTKKMKKYSQTPRSRPGSPTQSKRR